ncbi:winged helix-turn-helix domain-containing protein [Natronococcus roseus]|uniref:winged helix-turn-helix domain-containing protein n=1 Tax=Natronococcus roseus TaxID=1052014 RepID=UPI00374C977B
MEAREQHNIYINDADEAILQEIQTNGRATTGLLADIIGKSHPYISKRVTRLCEHKVLVEVASGLYDTPQQAETYLPE